MDNKVTHVLARAMVECGAPAFRFNFRGVGRQRRRVRQWPR